MWRGQTVTAMRFLTALLLTALVLAGVASAAWDQFQGDPARGATAVMPPGPWDVREVVRLFEPPAVAGGVTAPSFVQYGNGVVGVARAGDGSCLMIQWAPGGTAQQTTLPSCRDPQFAGVLGGRVLVCTWGAAAAAGLQAHDPVTGALAWRVGAQDIGAVAVASHIVWGCTGVVVDTAENVAIAPFGASRDGVHARQHVIAAVTADGSVAWTTFATDDETGEPLGMLFLPRAATLSQSGLAVTGTAQCAGLAGCTAGATTPMATVAYFDRSGQYLGAAWSPRGDGERYAVAAGARTAVRLGTEVVVADPLSPGDATKLRIDGFQQALHGAWQEAGPLVADGRVLFPLREQVVAVSLASPPARDWTWTGLAGRTVHGGFTAGGVAVATWDAADRATLVRLDPASGRVTQVVPLGLAGGSVAAPFWRDGSADQVGLSWVPLGTAGILAVAPDGLAVRIGAATAPTDSPTAIPDTFFPQPAEAVTMHLGAPGAAIAWGDGTVSLADAATEVSHAFSAAGRHDARVTFALADGTTRTRTLPFIVGGVPAQGDSERFPTATLEPPYPAPGMPFTMTLAATTPIVEAFVSWGDGAQEHVAPQALTVILTHTYEAVRRYDAVVTVVYNDGHAATDEIEMQVGGPFEDNFWQRAFAPENQDTTWGIIGIALAVVGGSIGLYVRWRRRSQFMKARQRIDDIRRLSRHEPLAALAELRDARTDMRSLHDRSRLDDSQYQIVRDACEDVLKRIMVLVLDPMRGALSRPFQQQLAAAQHDGALDLDESAELHAALAAEPITHEQREMLGRLLDAWAS